MDKLLIIDMCFEKDSLHFDEFVLPIIDILKNKIDFDIIHFLDLNEKKLNNYSHIIMCGTALKDFEYLNHLNKFYWIKNYKGYLLGICAGAQVIGKLFNSKIEKGLEIGLINIEKVDEDKILKNVNLTEVYSLHNNYSTVPKNFKLLLQTKHPQLFTNGKIYACLFHPEIRNKKLIENFIEF